jgi:hypothetical protein
VYGFRYYFTPLSRVLFTFPLRYWFTIGLLGVFSLTGWCRQIQAGFLRSRLTQDTARPQLFALTGLSPAMVQLSRRFSLKLVSKCGPITLQQHAVEVWAVPFSLATTQGITFVFFSSRYLDVSVPWVDSPCGVIRLQRTGLSHSEIFGYNACVQLPEAYRSLPRPSSSLRAKASTIHP